MKEKDNKNSDSTAANQDELAKEKGKRFLRVISIILLDLALCALFTLTFAYFHHVNPIMQKTEAIVIENPNITANEPNNVDDAKAEDISEAQDSKSDEDETDAETIELPEEKSNPLKVKFADKFTDGEIIITDNQYITDSISITINKVEEYRSTYYVADIYISDIEYFKTGFAAGSYDQSKRSDVPTMLKEHDGIIGISGDYYGLRDHGLTIRNGVMYRSELYEDVLVMFYDGTMETIKAHNVDVDDLLSRGAYQSWSFGPILLDDGQVIEKFYTPIEDINPRSAIGYYEPGHYAFVVVDGRQYGYSTGVTLTQLSQIFYDLGCTAAYNLDGGQTAVMAFQGELYSQPINGGRNVSDIVYIGEGKNEEIIKDDN